MSETGKNGPLWQSTLTLLKALGTNDSLAPGQLAIVTDEPRLGIIECATAAASTSTWVQKREFRLNGTWNVTQTTRRYFRWAGGSGAQAGLDAFATVPLRDKVVIESMSLLCTADPGSTGLRVHLDRNVSELELVTVSPGGALTQAEFAFSATSTIPAGSDLAVSIHATNAPGLLSLNMIGYRERAL